MSDLRERVARAICRASEDWDEDDWDLWLAEADAAIAIVWEEAMERAIAYPMKLGCESCMEHIERVRRLFPLPLSSAPASETGPDAA